MCKFLKHAYCLSAKKNFEIGSMELSLNFEKKSTYLANQQSTIISNVISTAEEIDSFGPLTYI